jgi:hypothetical protein
MTSDAVHNALGPTAGDDGVSRNPSDEAERACTLRAPANGQQRSRGDLRGCGRMTTKADNQMSCRSVETLSG